MTLLLSSLSLMIRPTCARVCVCVYSFIICAKRLPLAFVSLQIDFSARLEQKHSIKHLIQREIFIECTYQFCICHVAIIESRSSLSLSPSSVYCVKSLSTNGASSSTGIQSILRQYYMNSIRLWLFFSPFIL